MFLSAPLRFKSRSTLTFRKPIPRLELPKVEETFPEKTINQDSLALAEGWFGPYPVAPQRKESKASILRKALNAKFEEFEQRLSDPNLPRTVYSSVIVERLPVLTKWPRKSEWDAIFQKGETFNASSKEYPAEYVSLGTDKAKEDTEEDAKMKESNLKSIEAALDERYATLKSLSSVFTDINREGDKRVYLVVKDKVTGKWGFPLSPRKKGESLITTAIRHLSETVGKEVLVYPVSALPVAHTVPANVGRVFFHRVQYLSGHAHILNKEKYSEHRWVNIYELNDHLDDETALTVKPALAK